MTDTKDESDVESRSLDDNLTAPVLDRSAVDPVYQAKAHVLNNAIQQIGMGRYQWELVSPKIPFQCSIICLRYYEEYLSFRFVESNPLRYWMRVKDLTNC